MASWLESAKDALVGKGFYDPEILQTVKPGRVFANLDDIREMHRKHYAKLCQEMIRTRVAGTRYELGEAERSLSENLEAMVGQVQRVTWAEQHARALRREIDEAQRRLAQEYAKLCQLPLVTVIAAKDGLVQVTTAPTNVKHQGKAYRIGRLQLLIDPNGGLTIQNVTQPVILDGKRYDHPCVVEGKLWPAEVSGVVGGMICRGELSELVEWLGEYLGDYDVERACCPVEAWPLVNLDEPPDAGKQGELPPDRDEVAQRLFVQACLQPGQARVADSEKAVAEAERNYETLYNEIHALRRRIEEIRERLIQLELGGDKGDDYYEEEYNLLCELPGVREVRAKQGLIEVFTETLYISYDGSRHKMGDFRIDLWVGKGVKIRKLENLLLTLLRECHPHIRGTRPCFGNVEERISKELSRCNFKDVILLCLEFLQSYNPRSVYRNI